MERIRRQQESKITTINGEKLLHRAFSSCKSLLDRVAFCFLYIARRVGYKTVVYNATTVGVGRRSRGTVAGAVLLLLLLSILLCILFW